MIHFDIAIIGTGSGNTITDERYADKRIALCEEGVFGGTCINVGCIPTKMFVHTAEVADSARDTARFGVDADVRGVRWTDVVARVFGRIDPLVMRGEHYRRTSPNVTVFRSHTRFAPATAAGRYALRTDDGDEFTADQVVIAVGSRATVPHTIAESGVDYHTSDTIMRLPELPERVVIVGGGFIASEFAHVFSGLGSLVTLVVRGNRLLRQCDDTVCERFTEVAATRWAIHRNRHVVDARQDHTGITVQLDDGSQLQSDALLIATGRVPNGDRLDAELAGVSVRDGLIQVDDYQRTTARGIYALGDVSSGYQLKHVANHEARVVGNNLLADWDDTDALMPANHRYIPSAVFTDPQIATVGLTESEARARGYNVIAKVHEYANVAYGWALEDTTSFAKVIADADTGLLLGAHIMGPQASTLIQPLIQAMSFGLTGQSLARQQYWIHPALPELIENVLLAVCGEPPWPIPRH